MRTHGGADDEPFAVERFRVFFARDQAHNDPKRQPKAHECGDKADQSNNTSLRLRFRFDRPETTYQYNPYEKQQCDCNRGCLPFAKTRLSWQYCRKRVGCGRSEFGVGLVQRPSATFKVWRSGRLRRLFQSKLAGAISALRNATHISTIILQPFFAVRVQDNVHGLDS